MRSRSSTFFALVATLGFAAALVAACGGNVDSSSSDNTAADARAHCNRVYDLEGGRGAHTEPPAVEAVNRASGVQGCVNAFTHPGTPPVVAIDRCLDALGPCPSFDAIESCTPREGSLANGSACALSVAVRERALRRGRSRMRQVRGVGSRRRVVRHRAVRSLSRLRQLPLAQHLHRLCHRG